MRANARARGAGHWVPVVLFLGLVTASAVATGATVTSQSSASAKVADPAAIASQHAGPVAHAENAPKPFAVAPLGMHEAPGTEARLEPQDKLRGTVQLASVDSLTVPMATDANIEEPFGALTLISADNVVWSKWSKVANDIRAAEPALTRCLADEAACSPAGARFAAIVKEARAHSARVRLNFVNQRVNNAIRYTSDLAQWGTPDEWSAPLAGGRGSFETGLGDCEDYAIAKYVALRAAGISATHLRILLVRDNIARLDHAVLAANDSGRWYILDNRWTAAVEDNDVRRFTPLFALDEGGVKLLTVRYASRMDPTAEPMREDMKGASQKRPPDQEPPEQTQSSHGGITTIGLRPSIL